MEHQLVGLSAIESSVLVNEQTISMKRKVEQNLHKEKLKLKKLEGDQARKQKSRQHKRARIEEACERHPDLVPILGEKRPARPRIESIQENLLETIVSLVTVGGAAHSRRREDILRSCRTLDDLHKELKSLGYQISRSATYLRLLPRNFNTLEGKRHVQTVPVKLIKAQTSEHKSNHDKNFCISTITNLNCLASFLGPNQVFQISKDDKCRVPLGMTISKKQKSLLMRVERVLLLPDHDWVKGSRQKLIPSVYAGLVIKENGMGDPSFVTYSGPTSIRIRSGKHDTSDAISHAIDFEDVLQREEFKTLAKTKTGLVKPIVIMLTDGGPDENPRYHKVIKSAITHFKNHDLDAIFMATNAPGRSAFNPVERRMAPLSQMTSGVILQEDHFGSHLDDQGKTIDDDLEKKNFKHAGETLGQLWNTLVIDKHPVEASYVEPVDGTRDFILEDVDQTWFSNHVRTSQYFTQVVKCDSVDCCGPHRSDLRKVLKSGFLPPPLKVKPNEDGNLVAADIKEKNAKFLPLFTQLSVDIQHMGAGFRQTPYDFYCPSVNHQLYDRTCPVCGLYFSSKIAVTDHVKGCHNRAEKQLTCSRIRPLRVAKYREEEALCVVQDDLGNEDLEWIDIENLDLEGVSDVRMTDGDDDSRIPIVSDFTGWIGSPWEDEKTSDSNKINE